MKAKRKPMIRVILFPIAIFLIWIALHLILHRPAPQPPTITGHRGAAGLAPENTMASVSAALDQGVRTIEVDIHRSQDDVLVVIHDLRVSRTTNGFGAVQDLTWDDLSQLDAGSHFSPEFAGEGIPRLEDVLERIKSEEAILYLEVKSPHRYPGIEEQILDTLQQHHMTEQVVVLSFDHDWLARFHALAPDIPVSSLGVWVGSPPLSGAESMVGVQWRSVVLDPTLIWRMHRQGIKVSVWTVNRRWQMRLLAWLGVDNITTNRPDRWTYPE